ncbi:hypothetical protein P692DRAFT_20819937 [Suillus brevipes Sb2]|nr:hypothetical protein P692DRAFT_20819937 [Suillus brevipes Sb2]
MMFTRFSTVVVILLGLTVLVNAGVPARRSTGDPDKRKNVMRVAQVNNVALAREDSSEPFRRPPGAQRVSLFRTESHVELTTYGTQEESSEPFRRPPGVQRGL